MSAAAIIGEARHRGIVQRSPFQVFPLRLSSETVKAEGIHRKVAVDVFTDEQGSAEDHVLKRGRRSRIVLTHFPARISSPTSMKPCRANARNLIGSRSPCLAHSVIR